MIEQVLQAINNYYVDDHCDLTQIFLDGVNVKRPDKFVEGQYILVLGSKMNDGVYTVLNIGGNKLTLDVAVDLVPELTKNMVACSLSIPKAILNLADEIQAYNAKNDGSVASESLGDYSVTYGEGATWITVFRNKLAPYKKAYLNLPYKRFDYDQWHR